MDTEGRPNLIVNLYLVDKSADGRGCSGKRLLDQHLEVYSKERTDEPYENEFIKEIYVGICVRS